MRESDSPEAKDLVNRQKYFEGASSLIELPNESIATDENLTSALEQNLRKLLKDVEKIRKASPPLPGKELVPDPSYLNRFLEQARVRYENQDFKACLEILQEGLKLAPGNPEVLSLIEKAGRESQLRRAEPDLAIRIAQIKAESMKMFEQGRYSECVERFKLLSELEPENYDLRDYLEISREEAEKQKPPRLNSAINEPRKGRDAALPEVPMPDIPAAASSHDEPLPPPILIEPQRPDNLIAAVQPILPLPPIQADSLSEVIPEPASKLPAKIPENKVTTQANEMSSPDFTAEWKAMEELTGTPESMEQIGAKKLKIAYLLGVGLVFGSVLGAWLALGPPRQPKSPGVQPQPPSSQVLADRTQLPIDLSKSVEGNQPTQARKAFKQGKLMEANRLCDAILETEPGNPFALNLKQEIRERLNGLGGQAMANRHWEQAIVVWNDVLRISPNAREASSQLKAARTNLKKQEQMDLASKLALEKRIQDLHQQITIAVGAGRYLPPSPGNAFELIQKLDSLSPDNTFGKEKLDKILHDLVALANRSFQARDYVSANTLVRQIQTYFPETPELKGLRENLKAEEARLAEAQNSWMQRAEAAMVAGHYVSPANDNAVAYCNQLLAIQPQNSKALDLKKESLTKAVAQAKALVQGGKYDDAKAVYSCLLYLPQNESQFLLNSQELKTEVDKLTFNAYAVAHDHTIGSCTGRLRFNGYQIAYVPSTDSKDGFVLKISEIVQVEPGDKLKIQFKGKTYRFQANAAKNVPENRARIGEIHQRLSALMASEVASLR